MNFNQLKLFKYLCFSLVFISASVNSVSGKFPHPDFHLQKQQVKLKAFEGLYTMKGNEKASVKISVSGNQLILEQQWDGQKIHFDRISELAFSNKDHTFSLEFKKSKGGSINEFLAFNRDTWTRVEE